MALILTPEEIGRLIRLTRRRLGLTQESLALATGTGRRFIVELERGKRTCQLGNTLAVLQAPGIQLTLSAPEIAAGQQTEHA